jgi:hypothetical protein
MMHADYFGCLALDFVLHRNHHEIIWPTHVKILR